MRHGCFWMNRLASMYVSPMFKRENRPGKGGFAKLKHDLTMQESKTPSHGALKSSSREKNSWSAMIQRCTNKKLPCFSNYGGRGITICPRWRTFRNFLDDMGPRPEGTTLERKNNDGNYEPENCIWATKKKQQNNLRSNNIVAIHGQRMTMAQAAEKFGVSYDRLRKRIKRGWTPEDSVSVPTITPNRNCKESISPLPWMLDSEL